MHGSNHIPAYLPTHINVDADYLSQGRLVPEWHLLPHIVCSISMLGSDGGGSVIIFKYKSISGLLHLGKIPLPLGALGMNAFNHTRTFGWVMCLFLLHWSPRFVQISCRTCQRSTQTSHSSGTLLGDASWIPTVLNLFVDIPHCCSIIINLNIDVLVNWVLKGLPSLHLTLGLLRDVCCADKGSLPQSVRQ